MNVDELGIPPSLDKETAQRAAADFQNMMRQLADMQKVMLEQIKTSGGEQCKSTEGSIGTVLW